MESEISIRVGENGWCESFYRHFSTHLPPDYNTRTVRLRDLFCMSDARDYLHDTMLIKLGVSDRSVHDRSIHTFDYPDATPPFDLEVLCSTPTVASFEEANNVLVLPPSVCPLRGYTPGCILKTFGRTRNSFMLCYEDGTIRALLPDTFVAQIATRNIGAYVRQYLRTELRKIITNTSPDDVSALFAEDGSLLAYLRDIKITDP